MTGTTPDTTDTSNINAKEVIGVVLIRDRSGFNIQSKTVKCAVNIAKRTPTVHPRKYPHKIRSIVMPIDCHPVSEMTISFMERSVSSGEGKSSSLLPTSIDSSCQIKI